MKNKLNPKRVLRQAREHAVLDAVYGTDGQPHVVHESAGVRLATPMESTQAMPLIKEIVSTALDFSVSRPEARDIFETMQGELLTNPGETTKILPRVGLGEDGPEILLDSYKGRVVQFIDGKYRVVRGGTATFIHSESAEALPKPIRLKTIRQGIKLFRELTRLPKKECMLVILWILHAYMPYGPYLLLIIYGESKSGKSFLTEFIRLLVDPSKVLTRGCPTNERELFSAAQSNHVIAIDNASSMSKKIFDALCRMSTGGGVSVRKGNRLVDEKVYGACRPVIINSIDEIGLRNDVLQRAIVIRLPQAKSHTFPEPLLEKFMEARPKILGSLFQAVAHGLTHLGQVDQEGPFRMAGFLALSMAAGSAFGWSEEEILDVYATNQAEAFSMLGESDALLVAIRELVHREGEWHGTASDLLKRVREIAFKGTLSDEVDVKGFPKAANALSVQLDRAREALLSFGINFERDRAPGGRKRLIHLTLLAPLSEDGAGSPD